MKTILRFALISSAMLAGLTAGYCLRGWHDRILRKAQLEEEVFELSFSEVENAKAKLRDLFSEFTNRLMEQYVLPGFGSTHHDPECLDRAVRELSDGITAFRGTEQELRLTWDLLWILKLQQADQAWLDLYLDLLYRRSTEDMVGALARQARVAAKATAREAELCRGFEHLRQIPFDFPGKQRFDINQAIGAKSCESAGSDEPLD